MVYFPHSNANGRLQCPLAVPRLFSVHLGDRSSSAHIESLCSFIWLHRSPFERPPQVVNEPPIDGCAACFPFSAGTSLEQILSPLSCCCSAYWDKGATPSQAPPGPPFSSPAVTAPSDLQVRFWKTQTLFFFSFFSCVLPSLPPETSRNPL